MIDRGIEVSESDVGVAGELGHVLVDTVLDVDYENEALRPAECVRESSMEFCGMQWLDVEG